MLAISSSLLCAMLSAAGIVAKQPRSVARRAVSRPLRRKCTASAPELTAEQIAAQKEAFDSLFDHTEDVPNQFAKDSAYLLIPLTIADQ